MSKLTVRSLLILSLLVAMAGLSGCTAKDESYDAGATKAAPTQAAPQSGPTKLTAAQEAALGAILAKADGLDGQTDKVVTKCASCALHMDGKKEHASTIAGYEMHFCRAGCKERFDEDLPGHVLKVKIPES